MSERLSYHVRQPWLDQIDLEKKIIENRVGPLSKHQHLVGKEVKFYCDNKEIKVFVTGVIHYDNLEELLDAEGWKNAAPHLNSKKEVIRAYCEFYTPQYIIDNGGINCIKFVLVK